MIKIKLFSGETLEGTDILESYTNTRVAFVLTDGRIAEFSINNIESIKEM